jgi:NAD(P)-dependent dehydrogenase (short-subunit alcohol dehydrogenase family)
MSTRVLHAGFIERLGRRFSLLVALVTAAGAGACAGVPASEQRNPSEAASTVIARSEAMAQSPVVMITGSTNGLGRELALEMGDMGFRVIVHGRDAGRGREVVSEIERRGGSAAFYTADLASLQDVRGLGAAVLRDYDRLDVLINNAGIWLRGSDVRQLSADGHELSFAVNYLSHFLLTHQLMPLLLKSSPARIINVASGAQASIDLNDVMLERNYSGSRSYAQSKLAQILFTFDLAEQLRDTGVTANSLHPATLMDTPMVAGAGVQPRSSVREGVEAVMHLVTAPEPGSGLYFDGTTPARAHDQAYDRDARATLRRISRELVGLH